MTEDILEVDPFSPEARPVLEGLAEDSLRRRSGGGGASASPWTELTRYPAEAFAPPAGSFLILRAAGRTVAGGGFMSHDEETAEIKRVWTHPDWRRRGLARRIMAALEDRAIRLGYGRIYLTTGSNRREAVAAYLALGYRPLFDVNENWELFRSLPFDKHIGTRADCPGSAPLRQAASSPEAALEQVAAIKAEQERRILARLEALRRRRVAPDADAPAPPPLETPSPQKEKAS